MRFAQQALGQGGKAVHRAYAKNARVHLPPLDAYEKQARNIIALPQAPAAMAQPTVPGAESAAG